VSAVKEAKKFEALLRWCSESLVLNVRVSGLVGFDDFAAFAVQLAAEEQVVIGVGSQMLAEAGPNVLRIQDVLPIIIFSSLSYRRMFNKKSIEINR